MKADRKNNKGKSGPPVTGQKYLHLELIVPTAVGAYAEMKALGGVRKSADEWKLEIRFDQLTRGNLVKLGQLLYAIEQHCDFTVNWMDRKSKETRLKRGTSNKSRSD